MIPIIADSVPVDGLKGSRGGVGVKFGVAVGLLRWLAQGFAIEGEAVRGVDEAVEHGVGDGGVGDDLMPVIDGELAGHDDGVLRDNLDETGATIWVRRGGRVD